MVKKELIVAPSILSADFANMAAGVRQIETSGADWVHCDVMDGCFVPNISFGQKMVADVRKCTKLPLDVHLMILEPERYVEEFVQCGADFVTVHVEATEKMAETLLRIRQMGAKAGISLKPATPVSAILPYLDLVDLILIMGVVPGFSGQKFMPVALQKLTELKEMTKSEKILHVDGGVCADNIQSIRSAGADAVVTGSAFFGASDPAAVVTGLKGR